MADNKRSLADLVALLADNLSGDIGAQDVRDVLVSVLGSYGSISVADGATAQTGLDTTLAVLEGWTTDGPCAGVTPDQATGKLTVGVAGDYMVCATMSFSGSVNTEFHFHVFNNGVGAAIGIHRKLGSGGDVGSAAMTGIVTCAAGAVLDVRVATESGSGKEVTLVDAQLVAHCIG